MNTPFSKRQTGQCTLLLPFAIMLSIQACTTAAPQTAPALNCAELNKVIAAADNHFSAIIAGRTDSAYGAIWKTSTYAYGQSCTLVGTANVPGQYFCSIPDKAQADAPARLEAEVAACLGSAWQRAALPRGSRFTRAGSDVIVDAGVNDAQAARAAATGLLVRAPKR